MASSRLAFVINPFAVQFTVNLNTVNGSPDPIAPHSFRLRPRRDAVIFVDDLYAHAEPWPPSDPDRIDTLRRNQIGGQWIAEQIGDRHLRMAVLHRTPHFTHRIAGQHTHQYGARRPAPTGSADEEAFEPRRKGEQRQQHIARIALRRRQRQQALAIAYTKLRRWPVLILDVVVRADDRGVDDPEIGLAQGAGHGRALAALIREGNEEIPDSVRIALLPLAVQLDHLDAAIDDADAG